MAATLTGASTLTTIVEWAADAHHRNVLTYWRTIPSIATTHRALARLDADVLDMVVTTWIRQRVHHTTQHHDDDHDAGEVDQPPGLAAIAIDGKDVRGAKHGGGTKTMLMAAYDHRTGTVLGQESVHEKSNEIPFLPGLLDQLGDLTDTVITVDALHTLAQQATAITSRGGHYLFTVKTNAKALHTSIDSVGWSRRTPQYQHTEKPTAGSVAGNSPLPQHMLGSGFPRQPK